MSMEERLETLQFCDSKYYFIQFENDVKLIFDEVCKIKDIARVGVNILKGNIYLKGDYFIPLKSADTIQLNCEELIKKLQTISCVLDVEVDSNYNLTFRLKRDMVFKAVLEQVTSLREQYGMFKRNKYVLVLTNQEKSKSLDNLRNNLLAEHVTSILANNGFKVFYNDHKTDSNLILPKCSRIVCSDECTLVDVCEDLKEKVNTCDYKIDYDDNRVKIDAKTFIEDNCLSSTYGNSLSSIILCNENSSQDLLKTSYIKHLIKDHMACVPDIIIHISSQGQNRSTLKSGVLLSMLGGFNPMQVYIFNQSVQYKGDTAQDANYAVHKGDTGQEANAVLFSSENSEDSMKNLLHDTLATDNLVIAVQGENNPTSRRSVLCEGTVSSTEDEATDGDAQHRALSLTDNAADEFISSHRLEIERATAMKYDTYDAGSETWASRVRALADAAVKFDVLKQNHSSILNLRPPAGRDGEKNFGVFSQYNYARLSNLFRNFESKVEEGTYAPLCALGDVDFGLLELEEEWHLFHYVLSFPKVVEGVLDGLTGGGKGRIRLNRVCLMLMELCQALSLYYGRVRILGGPQPHLQRAMNARLWMLKGIQQVFENSFRMLNIQSLDMM